MNRTRLVVNGRTILVTHGSKKEVPAPRADIFAYANPGEEHLLPKAPVAEPQDSYWEDERYGVKFPIVDTLQPESQWFAAATILAWYSCNYDMLMAYVKKGWIACAIQRNARARRFRVLKPNELADEKVRRALKRK